MKSYLTGEDLFTEILILRNVSKKTFLLLEGDSDCNCLDPHVDESYCETIPGYSKSAVLRAMELVDHEGVTGVVALVDRDWIGFCEERPISPNVLVTDRYDLDATIFFSGQIAHRFFATHGARVERNTYLTRCGVADISRALARIALPVGFLRLISYRERYGLGLRDFPLHGAIRPDCTALDIEAMVRIAYKRSRGGVPSISKSELVEIVSKGIGTIHDGRDYCSGHDVANALAAVITRQLNLAISRDAAARGMRAMFSVAELKTTQLFEALKEWADHKHRIVWKIQYSD